MTQIQLSISRLANHDQRYHFFFRTDWMEPDEALIVLEELHPLYRITITERTTTTTVQTL